MKKNIFLCIIGIGIAVYAISLKEATPLSGLLILVSVFLITYAFRFKVLRMVKKMI